MCSVVIDVVSAVKPFPHLKSSKTKFLQVWEASNGIAKENEKNRERERRKYGDEDGNAKLCKHMCRPN